jgi:hypothetical protein
MQRTTCQTVALCAGALLPLAGCAEFDARWGYAQGPCNTPHQSFGSCADPGAVIVYAAVVVVVEVVVGTARLIQGIRDRFRDGSGGIAWDSAEGKRLRGE